MYKNLPSKILHVIIILKIMVALIPKTSRINSSNFLLQKKKCFLTCVIMLLFTKLLHSKNKKEQVIPDF